MKTKPICQTNIHLLCTAQKCCTVVDVKQIQVKNAASFITKNLGPLVEYLLLSVYLEQKNYGWSQHSLANVTLLQPGMVVLDVFGPVGLELGHPNFQPWF